MNRFSLTGLMLVILTVMVLPLRNGVQATSPGIDSRLKEYRLSGSPIHLEALHKDGSGITWHADRGTLFVIRNTAPVIHEIDTAGRLLREIRLKGFSDTEGIAWIEGNLFAVLEERECAVVFVKIDADTTSVDREEWLSMARPEMNPDRGNRGCEDIAWDSSSHVLYLSREMEPVRLVRIEGLSVAALSEGVLDEHSLKSFELLAADQHPRLMGDDISGLHFNADDGQLLVLSDESRSVTSIDDQGRMSLPFSLGWFSSGLLDGIHQPEGVTMDTTGALYVLSEPDLLYIFRHRVN